MAEILSAPKNLTCYMRVKNNINLHKTTAAKVHRNKLFLVILHRFILATLLLHFAFPGKTACVRSFSNGKNGTTGRQIPFKVLPMVPLVMPLVPKLPMVPMLWYQWYQCYQHTAVNIADRIQRG